MILSFITEMAKRFLCFFLFGNVEVEMYLCYSAIKHRVLASFKNMSGKNLELWGDGWGRMA